MPNTSGGRLTGKRAIVTGAASGFGEGIARRFIEEGATVAIADIAAGRAQAAAARLGASCMAITCDVADRAAVDALYEEVGRAFGGLDILVNNAGMGVPPAPLEAMDEASFERLMAVNVRSVFLMSRRAVPLMKAQRSGAILNIASTGGVSPRPNLVWYNASKGWMIAAGRAMAAELAPSGVRVNVINPVAGDTPMLATFMGSSGPEARARFAATIPMGRLSTPDDIANAAVYLCSDEASLVTGVALEVDGGRCL